MAFRAIQAAPGRHVEEISVSVKREKRDAAPRLRVSIHEEVAKSLGWRVGMMVLPLVGDGPDHGLVKLERTDRKGFKITHPARSVSRLIVVFRAPKGSPESFDAQSIDYTIGSIDKSLTIRLPWAQRLRAIA